MNRKTAKRFLLLHIAAVATALLFPLYARFADFLSRFRYFLYCMVHTGRGHLSRDS